jgi:hypothetical protein
MTARELIGERDRLAEDGAFTKRGWAIAPVLGVVVSGIETLHRIGPGDGISGGNAGQKLEDQGCLTPRRDPSAGPGWWRRHLTAIPEAARRMGHLRR